VCVCGSVFRSRKPLWDHLRDFCPGVPKTYVSDDEESEVKEKEEKEKKYFCKFECGWGTLNLLFLSANYLRYRNPK
jgi:hypothetical protein